MAATALGILGILILSFQCLNDNIIKRKKIENKSVGNYYDFSKHRQFLMGVAAFLICVFHSLYYNTISADLAKENSILNGVVNLVSHCNIGVEIFLLLSGIGLYFSFCNKKVNFFNYYKKRVLNVYLIALIIDLPYVIYSDLIFENKGILYAVSEWLGLLNWTGKTHLAWYVVFAMILYAIYPLIYKILKRLDGKKYELIVVVAFCILWSVLCKVISYFLPDVFSVVEIAITRIPIFIIGCYLGKFVYNKRDYSNLIYIVSILGMIIFIVFNVKFGTLLSTRLSHCLFAVGVCLILIKIANLIEVKLKFIYKFFDFLGGMSLELYLVHMILAMPIFDLNGVNSIPLYCAIIVLSILISYYVSKLRKCIVKKYCS